MKKIKQYVCLVDNYRRPSRQRNTAGRYRVAAKTKDEAASLLRTAIGFGSVQVYYEDTNPAHVLPYKNMVKESFTVQNGKHVSIYTPVRHANEPL